MMVLLRILEQKFGPLSGDYRRRVEEADPDTLLAWSERVLAAERIEDVFGQ